MIFVFLFLTYFTQYNRLQVHPSQMTDSNVFLFMASTIPLYMCTSFFICSSDDEHLGCFHGLAIVNSAAVNFGVHVPFTILVSSGYMTSSRIAGSYGSSTSQFFEESPYCLP